MAVFEYQNQVPMKNDPYKEDPFKEDLHLFRQISTKIKAHSQYALFLMEGLLVTIDTTFVCGPAFRSDN
jgi:hypothetical protein